jgi:hypothetical protein
MRLPGGEGAALRRDDRLPWILRGGDNLHNGNQYHDGKKNLSLESIVTIRRAGAPKIVSDHIVQGSRPGSGTSAS